jgi:uncharacterized membrane protein
MPMDRARVTRKISRLLWIAVCLLVLIGIGIVARSVLTLAGVLPAVSARGPRFETRQPAWVLVLHVLPGLLFMLLGPLQFVKGLRARYIRLHRWGGRVFVISAYIAGLSALVMPFFAMPIGGISEAAGSVFFAVFFLIALSRAWRHILRKETALHREWMIRAFAVGLAIATVRPIMVAAFTLFGLQPHDFLGTAFWAGFTLHLMAAEIWVNYTRSA